MGLGRASGCDEVSGGHEDADRLREKPEAGRCGRSPATTGWPGAAGSQRGGKGLSRGPRVQGEGSPAQPDLTATRQLPSTPGLCPSVTVSDGAGPRPNSKWPRKTFQATQTRGCLKVTPATCRLPSGPPSVPPAMRGLLVTTATSALSPACQPVHHCAASF